MRLPNCCCCISQFNWLLGSSNCFLTKPKLAPPCQLFFAGLYLKGIHVDPPLIAYKRIIKKTEGVNLIVTGVTMA